mmetsp:Transcript_35119/g.84975  ORF Transcript_35119/g.84975 Transcript_35119/m.84975 type:complete len:481 (-) Transcript_35119:1071-2513(-)
MSLRGRQYDTFPDTIDEESHGLLSSPATPPPPPPPPLMDFGGEDSFNFPKLDRGFSSTTPLRADNIPRLVKRNLPNFQSKQRLAVVNRREATVRPLKYRNWFHVFLRWETKRSVAILVGLWTSAILFFAIIYRLVDSIDPNKDCGLASEAGKVIDILGAVAFSLETATTVGYGLPGGHNGFFEHCPLLQGTIYFQMVYSMLFNAFLFAFFFSRLARADSRGNQMLFSNKAIVEYREGKWLFHVRVYDLDAAHPVVEAHVRLYVVSWMDYEWQDKQPHLLHTMRLLQPNDDLGGMLFTSVPSAVTHHIDAYSPLTPPHLRDTENLVERNGLALREVDRMVENNGGIICPVCGETYGTYENLKNHIEYSKLIEKSDPLIPVEGSHRDIAKVQPDRLFKRFEISEQDIRNNLHDKEIMIVLEAIEPLISGTFQALHSYTADDIVFGGKFAPCMSQKDGEIFVDLDKFHQVIATTPRALLRKRG